MLQDAYKRGIAPHVSVKAESFRAARGTEALVSVREARVSASAEWGDDLWQATVDGLPSHVAVLDESGVIRRRQSRVQGVRGTGARRAGLARV